MADKKNLCAQIDTALHMRVHRLLSKHRDPLRKPDHQSH